MAHLAVKITNLALIAEYGSHITRFTSLLKMTIFLQM